MTNNSYFPPEAEVYGSLSLSTVICQSLDNYESELIKYDEE